MLNFYINVMVVLGDFFCFVLFFCYNYEDRTFSFFSIFFYKDQKLKILVRLIKIPLFVYL